MKRLWGSVVGVLVLASISPRHVVASEGTTDAQGTPAGGVGASPESTPSPEVEIVVAAGEASGVTGFGCHSTQTRVRYVAGAVEVRHARRPIGDPRGAGFTALGGGVVGVGEEIVLDEPPGSPGRTLDVGTVGAHLRFGYHWRWVGVEGGVGVLAQAWHERSFSGDKWILPYPDIRLSVGPRDRLHAFVGMGNSQPSSMGFGWPYGGVGYVPSSHLRLEGRFAIELMQATTQLRGDLTVFFRVAPHWSFRAGGGIGHSLDAYRVDPLAGEGNLGVVYAP